MSQTTNNKTHKHKSEIKNIKKTHIRILNNICLYIYFYIKTQHKNNLKQNMLILNAKPKTNHAHTLNHTHKTIPTSIKHNNKQTHTLKTYQHK